MLLLNYAKILRLYVVKRILGPSARCAPTPAAKQVGRLVYMLLNHKTCKSIYLSREVTHRESVMWREKKCALSKAFGKKGRNNKYLYLKMNLSFS